MFGALRQYMRMIFVLARLRVEDSKAGGEEKHGLPEPELGAGWSAGE